MNRSGTFFEPESVYNHFIAITQLSHPSANQEVVETSTNLYGITIDGNTVTIGSSNRSSCDASLAALSNVQANIGSIFQFNVTTGIDSYPSWQPNSKSPLKQIATES